MFEFLKRKEIPENPQSLEDLAGPNGHISSEHKLLARKLKDLEKQNRPDAKDKTAVEVGYLRKAKENLTSPSGILTASQYEIEQEAMRLMDADANTPTEELEEVPDTELTDV